MKPKRYLLIATGAALAALTLLLWLASKYPQAYVVGLY